MSILLNTNMRLLEFGKGKAVSSSEYKLLYHLTDNHGYAYTIANDSLKSSGGVCTTYDPTMNSVTGNYHYDFKFVLSGELIERYGAYHYDDHFHYVGSSKLHSHNEREIRLETTVVEPFSEYLIGTILMFPLFSEKGIQWLLYHNGEYEGMFSKRKSEAPTAIEMLYRQIYEWNKPIWKMQMGDSLTIDEIRFIKDAYRIAKKGGSFKDGLIKLSQKYPIVDHQSRPMTSIDAKRQFMAPKLVKILNGYYIDRPKKNINLAHVKAMLIRIFNIIGVGNNAVTVLMHEIEDSGLLHRSTAPVTWGSIISVVLRGDVDEAIHTIRFLGKKDEGLRNWHDEREDIMFNGPHYGTMFGRSSRHG